MKPLSGLSSRYPGNGLAGLLGSVPFSITPRLGHATVRIEFHTYNKIETIPVRHGVVPCSIIMDQVRGSQNTLYSCLLHPDFGAFLANLVSRSSRVYRNAPEEPFCLDQGYLEAAQEKFNQGFDAAIFGHIHYPIHHTTPKTLIVLGDWIQHFSYAVLEDGRFELRRWEHPELGSIKSDSETVTCQQSSGIIEDGLA